MKILRFETFDFQAFKTKYAERCEKQLDMTEVRESHIQRDTTADFVEMGLATQDELDKVKVLTEEDAPVIRKPLRKTQTDTILMAKTYFLMDQIIYRSIINSQDEQDKPRKATMNASAMKDVLGKDYRPILEAFKDLHYICCDETYTSRSAKTYEMTDDFEEVDCPEEIERKVEEYREKSRTILTQARIEQMVRRLTELMRLDDPGATEEDARAFLHHYHKDLNKIGIADEEGMTQGLEERRQIARTEKNKKGEPKDPRQIDIYYDMLHREIRGQKGIYKLDEQGRIYHFLTALKRELKDYLTISFSLDCKNSHPLLFNHILFYSFFIDTRTALDISRLMVKLYNSTKEEEEDWEARKYHYVGKSIRKYLIDNGIKESDIAIFPDDALLFVFETTNGIFWDEICRKYPEYNRNQVKQKMFQEVFYSNTSSTTFKEYGKIFEERYPAVYGEITRWKNPGKSPYIQRYLEKNHIRVEKPTAALPIALMSLESRIFRSALASLYRRRYHAVHIHDCIVIPETRSKHQPTPEEVTKILMKEYRKYGLIPVLKAE